MKPNQGISLRMKQHVSLCDTGFKKITEILWLFWVNVSTLASFPMKTKKCGNVCDELHDPEEQIPSCLIMCKWFTRSPRHRGDPSAGPRFDLNTCIYVEMDLNRHLPSNRLPFILSPGKQISGWYVVFLD